MMSAPRAASGELSRSRSRIRRHSRRPSISVPMSLSTRSEACWSERWKCGQILGLPGDQTDQVRHPGCRGSSELSLSRPNPSSSTRPPRSPASESRGFEVEAVGREMDAAEDDLPEPPGDQAPRPLQDLLADEAPARPPHSGMMQNVQRRSQPSWTLSRARASAAGRRRRSLAWSQARRRTLSGKSCFVGVRQHERSLGHSRERSRSRSTEQPATTSLAPRVQPGDSAG